MKNTKQDIIDELLRIGFEQDNDNAYVMEYKDEIFETELTFVASFRHGDVVDDISKKELTLHCDDGIYGHYIEMNFEDYERAIPLGIDVIAYSLSTLRQQIVGPQKEN